MNNKVQEITVEVVAKEILKDAPVSRGIIAIVMSDDEDPSFTTYALNFPRDTAVFMLTKMIKVLIEDQQELTASEVH